MDPLSAGMFASIGSAFKFADVAVRIAEVGSENAVFVRTIYVVRSDLEEVERLLSLEPVRKKLAATPGKLPWIKNALQNTRYALNEIGKWVERARVEQESTGSIKFDTKVRWVFSDHEKLVNQEIEAIAKAVKHNDWHNDFEKLSKQAKSKVDEERDALQSSIKGLGKTGLNNFYRRIQ
ncbi:hypothetical protein N0V87_007414 [Didymella glomerata]|uniref:Uncharacterized protein n=1 Tax=Didymella glomerata TaxID=749621 RepID=A0A9W8WUU5_9PLEO|nr:hypothetical protein N0V87_007414 [Didymella glomerata]